MDSIKLYNSKTNKLETLPIKEINVYLCGPTLYDDAHMGHARVYVTYDYIKRVMNFLGFAVRTVMNFTDIDKKIIEAKSDVQFFQKRFMDDMVALNVLDHEKTENVTENLQEIKEYIKVLMDRGFAYERNGSVYFNLEEYKKKYLYPVFIRKEVNSKSDNTDKRNKNDFALWKKREDIFWESEYGKGIPGWHVECSAIILKTIGKNLDIHVGGQDLKYPHHENELAQIRAHSDGEIDFFLHIGHININDIKMSKSLGNSKTIREELKLYNSDQIRFLFLLFNWKLSIDYSKENLNKAVDYYNHVKSFIQNVERKIIQSQKQQFESKFENNFKLSIKYFNTKGKVLSCLKNNINTAETLRYLKQLMSFSTSWVIYDFRLLKNVYEYIMSIFHMLGISMDEKKINFKTEFENFLTKILLFDSTVSEKVKKYESEEIDLNNLILFRQEVRQRALVTQNNKLLIECEELRSILKNHRHIIVSDKGSDSRIQYL